VLVLVLVLDWNAFSAPETCMCGCQRGLACTYALHQTFEHEDEHEHEHEKSSDQQL